MHNQLSRFFEFNPAQRNILCRWDTSHFFEFLPFLIREYEVRSTAGILRTILKCGSIAFVTLTAVIVDDEPLARQELLYQLQAAEDVEVVAQGSNGIEAVELIRTHKPDVVFLDVQMPGLDGFAVLKKLLDKKTGPPQVVFATAFDQ
jgi:PleD family two-component response regulator